MGITLLMGSYIFYAFQGTVASVSSAELVEPSPVMYTQSKVSPMLSASAWGIFDVSSGKIIDGNNIDTILPMASVSKLFTAVTVVESHDRDSFLNITDDDVKTEGTAGNLNRGDVFTPYMLLYPLLLTSSNDASEAIRRFLGDTFQKIIRDDTKLLGLNDTNLIDASGLSAQNVSTVSDLAKFYAYIHNTYPHLLDITQLHTYIHDDKGYINNNPGRDFKTFIGGKHGYTPEAQFTFVGGFVLLHQGTNIGIVLLGSKNLRADIQTILSTYDIEA